ncbi:hypothetical protein M422DRAFT_226621 [Sphaerobolus stellatus SS14]|uniref:Diacylglycerol O-acyltransferase n=1 Tax=Sphaerobolus stellatus (strain SS14) TaxID=990650 RepID=A0A0C9W3N6_SPHS4|nr:hypothetical protein M422DRAFT_226621 [Sphaerobolus stellatus SS14]
MPHPIIQEPSWLSFSEDGHEKYTRPLLGSEIIHDTAHRLNDGLGEVCMGLTFTTQLDSQDLVKRAKESLARLRFFVPIVASEIVSDSKSPTGRTWVYTPSNSEIINDWVNASITIRIGEFNPEDIIHEMNLQRLPYTHPDGQLQHTHWYLLCDKDHHGLFMHGPHTMMDAWPTLKNLDKLLEWIADPPDIPLSSLAWGDEWKNLPAGPMTATGGAREDWDTRGVKLLERIGKLRMNPVPTHSLHPTRDTIKQVGKMTRLHDSFSEELSSSLAKAVKRLGFTVGQLADAAVVLALFEGNQISVGCKSGSECHVTLDPVVMSQDRYLVGSSREHSHFVSGLCLVPISVPYSKINWQGSSKERLLSVMKMIKDQYDHFLENDNLPHVLPAQLTMYRPQQAGDFANQHASIMTNIGRLESLVSSTYGSKGDNRLPVIEVTDMIFGHRLGWQRL